MTQARFEDTPEARRKVMSSIRSKNTGPELIVRRMLHGMGCRFRLHRRDLPGQPDIVLPSRRVIVEVRGCFWHQHPGCPRARAPATRKDYWLPKLAANVARDARNAAALALEGWRLVVVWECEAGNLDQLATRLAASLGRIEETR